VYNVASSNCRYSRHHATPRPSLVALVDWLDTSMFRFQVTDMLEFLSSSVRKPRFPRKRDNLNPSMATLWHQNQRELMNPTVVWCVNSQRVTYAQYLLGLPICHRTESTKRGRCVEESFDRWHWPNADHTTTRGIPCTLRHVQLAPPNIRDSWPRFAREQLHSVPP
jgi:hypothetical protein